MNTVLPSHHVALSRVPSRPAAAAHHRRPAANDLEAMASYQAIRAIGESILALMQDACPLATLQLPAGAKFEHASFQHLVADRARPGFYLCLWRVGIGVRRASCRRGVPRRVSCTVRRCPSICITCCCRRSRPAPTNRR